MRKSKSRDPSWVGGGDSRAIPNDRVICAVISEQNMSFFMRQEIFTKLIGPLTTLSTSRSSAFFGIVQIDPRLNVVAIPPARSFLCRFQISARFIAPTALQQKCTPNRDFFFARFAAALEAPLQEFLVGSAFKRSIDKFVVIDPEKSRAASVESRWIRIKADKIIRRQFAFGFQSNLVQHSSKVD